MLDILKKRRSIRKFKNNIIEKDKIDKLVQAALLSPSSRKLQPWHFIAVDDKNILQELSKCKRHGSDFLKKAPLAVVVIADPATCDVWIEDASIASIIIQLEAESLDLSSCWIQVRERMHDDKTTSEDYIKEVLEIPLNFKVECIISIGYKDEVLPAYNENELRFDKVFSNKFGEKY
jgi:nitroreductase